MCPLGIGGASGGGYLTDGLLQAVPPDVKVAQSCARHQSLSQREQPLRPHVVASDRQPEGEVYSAGDMQRGNIKYFTSTFHLQILKNIQLPYGVNLRFELLETFKSSGLLK